MWGVLLNVIRHPYARAPSQVAPVALEEPAAPSEEEVAESDACAGRRAGKSCIFLSSFEMLIVPCCGQR